MQDDELRHHGPDAINRRTLLGRAAVAAASPWLVAGSALGGKDPGTLILREREPENLEYSFSALDSFLTPTEQFYVRNHFAVPRIDPAAWKLKVEGAVNRPLELSYEELRRMPSRTVTALLECAGNGRAFLTPSVAGVQWSLGAVGNAEWTGVPLGAVLERAGLRDSAVEVVLEGADGGELRNDPKPAGRVPFARGLPLEKARQEDVLLAYRMNGKDLTSSHGFPLRAVVPGWYGMASVKWLSRLVITATPFAGHYQTIDYATYVRKEGLPVRVPIGEVQVKAEIARPALHEVVPAGGPYRIYGAAWTGNAEVSRVEVSTDGGRSWSEARLQDRPVRHTWRRWEYFWQPGRPGRRTLMARATDSRGRTQPMERDRDRGSYMISHVLPIEVEVR